MSKKLTEDQIRVQAVAMNVPYAHLRAVIEVECRGSGFDSEGRPTILFERHWFRRRMIAMGYAAQADKAARTRPDICSAEPGCYGATANQHNRLNAAAAICRPAALEACSWGIGQVMGFHWKSLGYESLQAFINAMYRSEADQLDAMCRFLKVNNLLDELRDGRWAALAKGYNGPNYRINRYDEKLAKAAAKFK